MRRLLVLLSLWLLAGCPVYDEPCANNPGACSDTQRCDTATDTCVELPGCTTDADCQGYRCQANKHCEVTCSANASCAVDFQCQGSSCSSVVDQVCDPGKGLAACNGPTCDAATLRCTAARSCANDADCLGYVCAQGLCARFCGVDGLGCATGKTCRTSHLCQ